MKHNLDDTISLLGRAPSVLNVLLRDQPEIWARRNEGGNAWTPVDVIGHLISGERTDWIPRVKIILEHGPARTFEPFDMQGHMREIEGKSLAQLLDEFARMRSISLSALRAMNLSEDDLARRGRHPALGEVTMSQLLASWPVHDLTHLHQLSRIMAHQYREAVGPWVEYMGVLQCDGHGSR